MGGISSAYPMNWAKLPDYSTWFKKYVKSCFFLSIEYVPKKANSRGKRSFDDNLFCNEQCECEACVYSAPNTNFTVQQKVQPNQNELDGLICSCNLKTPFIQPRPYRNWSPLSFADCNNQSNCNSKLDKGNFHSTLEIPKLISYRKASCDTLHSSINLNIPITASLGAKSKWKESFCYETSLDREKWINTSKEASSVSPDNSNKCSLSQAFSFKKAKSNRSAFLNIFVPSAISLFLLVIVIIICTLVILIAITEQSKHKLYFTKFQYNLARAYFVIEFI